MDAKINRSKFSVLLGSKEWTNKEFFNRWKSRYDVGIKYSSFMELINNNISWKLSYAFSISEMLDVDINELFEFSSEINTL